MSVENQKEQEWINWAGGECPEPRGTFVEYRMRQAGKNSANCETLRWTHNGSTADIVAYRIVRGSTGVAIPAKPAMEPKRKEVAKTKPIPRKTLRDEFAMAALTGLIASPREPKGGSYSDNDSLMAYQYADAMMAARRGTP